MHCHHHPLLLLLVVVLVVVLLLLLLLQLEQVALQVLALQQAAPCRPRRCRAACRGQCRPAPWRCCGGAALGRLQLLLPGR